MKFIPTCNSSGLTDTTFKGIGPIVGGAKTCSPDWDHNVPIQSREKSTKRDVTAPALSQDPIPNANASSLAHLTISGFVYGAGGNRAKVVGQDGHSRALALDDADSGATPLNVLGGAVSVGPEVGVQTDHVVVLTCEELENITDQAHLRGLKETDRKLRVYEATLERFMHRLDAVEGGAGASPNCEQPHVLGGSSVDDGSDDGSCFAMKPMTRNMEANSKLFSRKVRPASSSSKDSMTRR